MSATLEQVGSQRQASTIRLNTTKALDYGEEEITPPLTPASPALGPVDLGVFVDLSRLLSKLKAPTHEPTASASDPQDITAKGTEAVDAYSDLGDDEARQTAPTTQSLGILASNPTESDIDGPPPTTDQQASIHPSESSDLSEAPDNTQSAPGEVSGKAVDFAEEPSAVLSESSIHVVKGSPTAQPLPYKISLESNQGTSSTSLSQVQPSRPVVVECIHSNKLYCLDKGLYVGKMTDVPCPQELEDEWMDVIRPRLVNDLMPVLRRLPASLSPQETVTEPDFCMAGYHSRDKSTTSVCLKPTVWIRCGSKKCRKAVRKAVDDLNYLHSFSQGPVEVRIRAPRPAASQSTSCIELAPPLTEGPPSSGEKFLDICPNPLTGTACGMRLRVSTGTAPGRMQLMTIGGLINLKGKRYGLTTAHGILSAERADVSPDDCSDSDSNSDSGSHLASDVHSGDDELSGKVPNNRSVKRDSATQETLSQVIRWRSLGTAKCGPISFCGRGSMVGGYGDAASPTPDADFALIEFDPGFDGLKNGFILDAQSASIREINKAKRDEELVAGAVTLLIGQDQGYKNGYLLERPSLFISKGVPIETRKIQLLTPLPPGTSGTWVVRDNYLCGVIVAVYDNEPYVHMVTAEKMLRDISSHCFPKSNFRLTAENALDLEGQRTAARRVDPKSSPTNDNFYQMNAPWEPVPMLRSNSRSRPESASLMTNTPIDQDSSPPFWRTFGRRILRSVRKSDSKGNGRRGSLNFPRWKPKPEETFKRVLRSMATILVAILLVTTSPIWWPARWIYRKVSWDEIGFWWRHVWRHGFGQWSLHKRIRHARVFGIISIFIRLGWLAISGYLLAETSFQLINTLGKDVYLLHATFILSLLYFNWSIGPVSRWLIECFIGSSDDYRSWQEYRRWQTYYHWRERYCRECARSPSEGYEIRQRRRFWMLFCDEDRHERREQSARREVEFREWLEYRQWRAEFPDASSTIFQGDHPGPASYPENCQPYRFHNHLQHIKPESL